MQVCRLLLEAVPQMRKLPLPTDSLGFLQGGQPGGRSDQNKVEGNRIFKNHLGVDTKVFQQASWYLGGAKEDTE